MATRKYSNCVKNEPMRTFPKTVLKWTLLPVGKNKAQKRKNKNGEERGNVKKKSEAPNGEGPESVCELRDAHEYQYRYIAAHK
jgi:hypothetical protein